MAGSMSPGGGSQSSVRELTFGGRVEHRHLDRPGRAERTLGGDRPRAGHGRVVQLHVADLQPALRVGGQSSGDRIGFREGERERLLGEDRQAVVEAGEHGRSMGAGREDEQGVEVARPKHVVERDVPTVGRDPVPVPDGGPERR